MLDKLRARLSSTKAPSDRQKSAAPTPHPQVVSPHRGTPESKRAYASLRWGITPREALPQDDAGASHAAAKPGSASRTRADATALPLDHPVHKMSLEDQHKLRSKGVNPVLKAEMDDAISAKGKRGFWSKSAFGGAWGLAI